MTELDFTIEFDGEGLSEKLEYEMFVEADSRLRELAEGHNDLIGSAINVRRPTKAETAFLYEVTVVIYARPNHIAASEKGSDPLTSLKDALSAIERQVRKKHDKLGKTWQQPGNFPIEQEITKTIHAETSDPSDFEISD